MLSRIETFLRILTIGLVCLGNAWADERPNILFFITDDQLKEMLNFLPEGEGKNLTPHTDRLATEGTVMMKQYVTSPVCTPSRFACLTGTYPSRSKAQHFLNEMKSTGGQTVVQWNTFITPGDQHTLPWMLKRAGYRTGIVGKNHVIEAHGIIKPDWDADPTDPAMVKLLDRNRKRLVEACKQAGFDYAASMYDNNPSHNGMKALLAHNMDWITKGTLDFIDSNDDRPFFLFMATTLPHGPTDDQRSWEADPRITADGLLDEPLNVQPARDTLPKRIRKAAITGWQKENLLWMDDAIGAVIAKLEEVGELDNTIIFYFNDHGQRSKGTVYEGGVHGESFIWRKGGWPAGKTSDAHVSNVDFLPTILDLAEVPYDPKRYDGVSFLPVLEGEQQNARESLYFELGYVRGVLKDGWKYVALRYPEFALNMSMEERQHRLDEFNKSQRRRGKPVYTENPEASFSHIQLIPGGGDAEHQSMSQYPHFYDNDQLYYLPDDPSELKNLVGEAPYFDAKLVEMQAELKQYLDSLPGSFGDLKTSTEVIGIQ